MNNTVVKAEPGKQEIVITRVFDAPRDFVFKANTDPQLIPQWWGPAKYITTVEKLEPKKGGVWRFIQKGPDGELAFNGVYHEVSIDRIIGTFEFEGLPEKGHVEFDTAILEELPGDRTKQTIVAVYQSVADRDAMLQSGMEEGLNEGYERLDVLLEKMKNEREGGE